MYCTRKVADDLIWVGADDRRLAMFEGVYSVPRGEPIDIVDLQANKYPSQI